MKTFEYKGRTFTLVGTRPYTRKDGSATTLVEWTVPCAHPGCVAPLKVAAPAGATPASTKSFEMKHCTEHKVTRAEALRRCREAIALNKAARKLL